MTKLIQILTLLFCTFILVINASAQSNESWKKKYKDCEVKLKIKGTSRHEEADHKFAEKYRDVELIWLKQEKDNDGMPEVVRVYLVSEKLKNGSHAEYIIHKKDKEENINAPIFPVWKSKKNRFYLAECFDRIQSEE